MPIPKYPEPAFIKQIYHHLANYCQIAIGAGADESFDFDIAIFCRNFQVPAVETRNALRVLEQHGLIYVGESFFKPSTVHISVDRETLYRYQIEHKQFEPVIKLILRTATGVFDEPVAIQESTLAYHSGITDAKMQEILRFLNDQEIIQYAPVKKHPQITWLQARMPSENLQLDLPLLARLKQQAIERMEAMTDYVHNATICRAQKLLQYFGEEVPACGICDICVEKNKLDLTEKEFMRIFEWLQSQLEERVTTPESLLQQTLPARREKILETIHFLVDNRQIMHTPDNQLIWRK